LTYYSIFGMIDHAWEAKIGDLRRDDATWHGLPV
jgi:hypothetical protein